MNDNPIIVNDLRLRVLNGEEISPEEMAMIVDQIRANRRSAAKPAKIEMVSKPKGVKATKLQNDDLASILDIEIE